MPALACRLDPASKGEPTAATPPLPPTLRFLPPPDNSCLVQVACLDDVRSVIKLEGAPLVEFLQVSKRQLLLDFHAARSCNVSTASVPIEAICSPHICACPPTHPPTYLSPCRK